MDSGIKVEVVLFGLFGFALRALVKPAMPIKLSSNAITFGIPLVGSFTIYYNKATA